MLIFHIWCITTIIITGSSLQRIVSCMIDQSRDEILYFHTIFPPLGDFSNTVLLDEGNTTKRNPSGWLYQNQKLTRFSCFNDHNRIIYLHCLICIGEIFSHPKKSYRRPLFGLFRISLWILNKTRSCEPFLARRCLICNVWITPEKVLGMSRKTHYVLHSLVFSHTSCKIYITHWSKNWVPSILLVSKKILDFWCRTKGLLLKKVSFAHPLAFAHT